MSFRTDRLASLMELVVIEPEIRFWRILVAYCSLLFPILRGQFSLANVILISLSF